MKYKAIISLTVALTYPAMGAVNFIKVGTVPPSSSQVKNVFGIRKQYVVTSRGVSYNWYDITGTINNFEHYWDSYSGSNTHQQFCSSGTYTNRRTSGKMRLTLEPFTFSTFNIKPGSNAVEYNLWVNGALLPKNGVSELLTQNPAHIRVCFKSTLGELAISNSYSNIYVYGRQVGKTTDESGSNAVPIFIEPELGFIHVPGSTPPGLSVTPSVIELATHSGYYEGKTKINMRGGAGLLKIVSSVPVTINEVGPVTDYQQSIRAWTPSDVLEGELRVSGVVPVGHTSVRLNLTRQYS